MTNSRWGTVLLASGGVLAALAVLALMGGCRSGKQTARNVPAEPPRAAEEAFVELTFPQSDPEGHCVALSEGSACVIEGTVASREPVRRVSVNGVDVAPYQIEHFSPYDAPEGLGVYRFRAPVIWQPGTRPVVVVSDPPLAREYVYIPDTKATTLYWRQAADATPSDARVQYRLGSALLAQNAYDDAAGHLTTALQGNESAPWTLYQLGMAYLAAGRADDGLKRLDNAVTVYPTFPDAHYARGVAYYDLHRYDQAVTDLTRASGLVPDWAEPLVALGGAYYAQGRLQDADRVYVRASEVWPTWSAPPYALAMVRLDEGRMKEANALLDRAEKLGPWRARHHRELAEKLFAKGNYVAAWRQVQIARKLRGEPPRDFIVRLSRKMPEPPEKPMWWTGKGKGGTEPPGLAKQGKEPSGHAGAKQPPGQADKGSPGHSERAPGHGGKEPPGQARRDEPSSGKSGGGSAHGGGGHGKG